MYKTSNTLGLYFSISIRTKSQCYASFNKDFVTFCWMKIVTVTEQEAYRP